MSESNRNSVISPSHPAPVGRLQLEVVNLKNQGIEKSIVATATLCLTMATTGCFAEED